MSIPEPFDYGIAEAITPSNEDRNSWEPIDLNDLPEHPPVQPTLGQIGDIGLVYPGKRHVFSGPQESAKTLVAYIVGLQVIRDGGIVVLIDFEMGSYDARNRLRELGATPDDLRQLRYLEPDQPATEPRLTALIAHKPQLVIVDAAAGAYDLQGLDDNKRQDVERIASLYVRGFWRNGIATIFLDHVVKDTKGRGSYAIGSERKVGSADVHLGFEVITPISRGTTGIYRVVTHKDRGGYLKRGVLTDVELVSHTDTHEITWTFKPAEHVEPGQTWMPTKVMQKISGLLEQQDDPVSKNALAGLAGGKRPVALDAIDHLVRLKYATETAGTNRSKLITHTRAFTVYEWENTPDPQVVPGGSQVVPGTTHQVVPGSSPPYQGNGNLLSREEPQVVPELWDWIDELSPIELEQPPDDLFAGTTGNAHDENAPLPDIDYSANEHDQEEA